MKVCKICGTKNFDFNTHWLHISKNFVFQSETLCLANSCISSGNKHNGILEVTLNKGNKHYYRTVCRLVLKTFLGIELGKNDIVMYRDNDKTNCELENLYVIARGKRQELTYDLDKRYRPKYEYYGQILPTKEIAKINNIEPKLIRQRIRNLYWNIYESAEIPKGIYKKGGE